MVRFTDDAVTLPRRSLIRDLIPLPIAGVPAAAIVVPDPIFAAIAAHRAACQALDTCPDDVSDAACDVCMATESDILATTPTSLAGLRALVEYADQRRVGYDGIPTQYFPAILAACRTLSPIGGAA